MLVLFLLCNMQCKLNIKKFLIDQTKNNTYEKLVSKY